MNMTKSCGWIWPKPTNLTCLNMTEYWQRRTFTCWTWPKTIEFDRKLDFRSYSPVKVCHCGNLYYIFGHVHHVKVRLCQFFGRVHKFWSNSFGHLHSVMLTTLYGGDNFKGTFNGSWTYRRPINLVNVLTKIDWQQLKFFHFLISFVDYFLLPLE